VIKIAGRLTFTRCLLRIRIGIIYHQNFQTTNDAVFWIAGVLIYRKNRPCPYLTFALAHYVLWMGRTNRNRQKFLPLLMCHNLHSLSPFELWILYPWIRIQYPSRNNVEFRDADASSSQFQIVSKST